MTLKWIKIVLALLMAGLINGCMEPPKPEEHIARASDKYMMQAMVKYIDWGSRNPDIIAEKIYISGDKGHIDGSIRAVIGEYNYKYDAMTEDMTRAYIKAAKKRGSIVKLYKKPVSLALANATPRSFSIDHSTETTYYNLDPALIEFNKDGEIVSVMLQKHKIYRQDKPVRGYLHYRYTEIITGKSAKRLEYSIGNNTLSNGFIREL